MLGTQTRWAWGLEGSEAGHTQRVIIGLGADVLLLGRRLQWSVLFVASLSKVGRAWMTRHCSFHVLLMGKLSNKHGEGLHRLPVCTLCCMSPLLLLLLGQGLLPPASLTAAARDLQLNLAQELPMGPA